MTFVFLDSITDARAGDRGKIAISGSHGGRYAAATASRAGLRAVVLNDAGRGLDDAGVAGVLALDEVAMAGAAVEAESAEIGSARDSFENGVLSVVNRTAYGLGLRQGMALKNAADLLRAATLPEAMLPAVAESRWEEPIGADLSVLCVDSASLIAPGDAGRLIVTGSHGGLIGGDPARACKADAKLVAFSDAGIGKNRVGVARLPALAQRRIAAVTLDCHSCRIGEAASALKGGIVSHVNGPAGVLGLVPGGALMSQLIRLF